MAHGTSGDAAEELGAAEAAKELLQNCYVLLFGVLLFVVDGPSAWVDRCFAAQSRTFKYFHFLATQPGRASFYLYVGTITMFRLPAGMNFKVSYCVLGGTLCVLGLVTLILRYCGCCKAEPAARPSQ